MEEFNETTHSTKDKECCALEPERATYSVKEAAAILGIGISLAYQPGVLPTVRIGGRILVPRAALRRLIGER
jgi:Helix-turn-helix domain